MISEQGPGRPLRADETPTEIFQAISAEQASFPARPPELPARKRERRQLKLTAALAVVIVVVIGVAAYEVASGVGGKPHPAVVAAATRAARVSVAPSSAAPSVSAIPTPSLTSSPSPSPSRSASPAVVVTQTLKPTGVTAVGPGGAAGDDPGSADLVIDGSESTVWQTEWYATPYFGGLQTGTGLLVSMGRLATITSVQVTLGPAAGADFEVRTGDSSSVSDLTTVATEAGAAGTVRLKLASPAKARYVLVWFTKLPPDGSGTYQLEVYNISVTGQP